jgi:hypothetical protein
MEIRLRLLFWVRLDRLALTRPAIFFWFEDIRKSFQKTGARLFFFSQIHRAGRGFLVRRYG